MGNVKDLHNRYIYIETKEQAEIVQLILFSYGIYWHSGYTEPFFKKPDTYLVLKSPSSHKKNTVLWYSTTKPHKSSELSPLLFEELIRDY